ncbi:MAG: TraR/DksA C4-type zinc finger protein [Myxococcales bacterium]|nr:TraR/DksA C4-type zinc finger protein [Myxococcales bacterium]
MTEQTQACRRCGDTIPPARLAAIPDTRVCVRCSEEIGGEFELEVTVSATGKAGSLKKTGQDLSVRRKPKPLAPVG